MERPSRTPSAATLAPLAPYAGLALLVLILLGGYLLQSLRGGTRVLGAPGQDIEGEFFAWRSFGFGALRHGRLPLWNPGIYSGSPYFGGFQAALLYPPNALFLFLPVAAAINASVALHVFLMGAFLCAWGRARGLRPGGAFLAGALGMLGGAFFPHVYAGHLSNLCTMVWAPLIFCAVDAVVDAEVRGDRSRGGGGEGAAAGAGAAHRRLGGVLLGAFAVAMQIHAGHPQYVFYTGVAAGLYGAFRMAGAPGTARPAGVGSAAGPLAAPLRTGAALWAIYALGAALSAFQLVAGLDAVGESVRSRPLPYLSVAAMFSLPPENLLTFIAPGFFGGAADYWGRCYLWEMTVFFGIAGLALAVLGVARGRLAGRGAVVAVVLSALVIALGAHTPAYLFLFRHVPGFASFRGVSKFAFPALAMLALLAGAGLDALVGGAGAPGWGKAARGGAASVEAVGVNRAAGWLAGAVAVLGLLLGGGALWARGADWGPVLEAIRRTNESYLSASTAADPAVLAGVRSGAVASLVGAAAVCALVAGVLAARRRFPWAAYGLAGIATVEVLLFARGWVASFESASIVPPIEARTLAAYPGDYRILDTVNQSRSMLAGAQDIWGPDPGVGLRYAEFMAFTQGENPDEATQSLNLRVLHPLFRLLRLKYVVLERGGVTHMPELPGPLPHVLLVGRARVVVGRDATFAAMGKPGFDPEREVLLDREPDPEPVAGEDGRGTGTARVVEATTDRLVVEADVTRPAVLLVTDLYTPSWRVRDLQPGSGQARYELLPADYILRGVPLAAGRHRLAFEYDPPNLALGGWVSAASLAIWAGLAVIWVRGRPGRRSGSTRRGPAPTGWGHAFERKQATSRMVEIHLW